MVQPAQKPGRSAQNFATPQPFLLCGNGSIRREKPEPELSLPFGEESA